MERFILDFHKSIYRLIKLLFVEVPARLGMLACVIYLVIGTIINFLFMIDHPFAKMGMVGAELKSEESDEG